MLGGDWTDGTMTDFKWRHFTGEVILWAVRWYCRYGISYRDLEEMLSERRSEEHTSELQSLMRSSYAVFCLKKKKNIYKHLTIHPVIQLSDNIYRNIYIFHVDYGSHTVTQLYHSDSN